MAVRQSPEGCQAIYHSEHLRLGLHDTSAETVAETASSAAALEQAISCEPRKPG